MKDMIISVKNSFYDFILKISGDKVFDLRPWISRVRNADENLTKFNTWWKFLCAAILVILSLLSSGSWKNEIFFFGVKDFFHEF